MTTTFLDEVLVELRRQCGIDLGGCCREMIEKRVSDLYAEADEILAMAVSSIKTAKRRK